jgi:hypothetical protein
VDLLKTNYLISTYPSLWYFNEPRNIKWRKKMKGKVGMGKEGLEAGVGVITQEKTKKFRQNVNQDFIGQWVYLSVLREK